MKSPLRKFSILAVILFIAACLPTGMPLRINSLIAAIVGCLGALGLGVVRAKTIYAIPLTVAYIFLSIRVPGYFAQDFFLKSNPYRDSFIGITVCLIACSIFYGIGRIIHIINRKRKK